MMDTIALFALAAWNEPRLVEAAVCGFIIVFGSALAAVLYRFQPGGGPLSIAPFAGPCGFPDPAATFSRWSVDSGALRLVLRSRFVLASVLAGTFANSACVGPVQGLDAGRGSTSPKSSSICVGVIP